MITLAPYGFYWFQLQDRGVSEPVTPSVVPEFETLVVPLGSTWVSLARTRACSNATCCRPPVANRWYPENAPERSAPAWFRRFRSATSATTGHGWPFSRPRSRQNHALSSADADRVGALRSRALQPDRVRSRPPGRPRGTLLDVATEDIFLGLLLRNLKESLTVEENGVRLEFRPTDKFKDRPTIRQPSASDRRDRMGKQHVAGRQRLRRQGLSRDAGRQPIQRSKSADS